MLAGLQGQGEQVGGLPVAGIQIDQHRQFAGIQITHAGQQLLTLAFIQVLQAIDKQGEVEALGGQVGR